MSATGDRQGGATLVETLVLMSVVALIGTIAFPNLDAAVSRSLFEQARAGVKADLRMARAQALRTGRPVALTAADNAAGYGWTEGPRRALLAGLRLKIVPETVRFLPDGSTTGGVVSLVDERRRSTFLVDAAGGVSQVAP